jgi:hypothetical protein
MMAGGPTLRSYGIESRWPGEIESLRWNVPRAHAEFLAGLPVALDLTVMGVRYWVVHAGVPIQESLAGLRADSVVRYLAQHAPESLLWPKTDPDAVLPVGRTVVMGHVPLRRPYDDGLTIGVDTGAGTLRGGQLTAVILPERRFVTVG